MIATIARRHPASAPRRPRPHPERSARRRPPGLDDVPDEIVRAHTPRPRPPAPTPATRRAIHGAVRAPSRTEEFRLMNALPTRDDAQLIELFLVGTSDEAGSAFEALVTRHGPAVMSVCRRVLDRREDAEDAVQMTFVALLRNAARIRNRQVLGAWLYGVAHRIAVRMRAQSARRRAVQSRPARESRPNASTMRPPSMSCDRSSTRRCISSRRLIAPSWCAPTWRAGQTRKSPGSSAAPSVRSRDGCGEPARCCGSGCSAARVDPSEQSYEHDL